MPLSVYERRKFVRIDARLSALVNRSARVVIQNLSLGGCLLESAQPFPLREAVVLEFTVCGRNFHLKGRTIYRVAERQYGIQFEPDTRHETIALFNILPKIQQHAPERRTTRLPVQLHASLDHAPAVIVNLSESGCLIQIQGQGTHQAGDLVEVRFRLDRTEIHVAAQVRWRNASGLGLEYLWPDTAQVSDIADFLVELAASRSSSQTAGGT